MTRGISAAAGIVSNRPALPNLGANAWQSWKTRCNADIGHTQATRSV